MAHRSMVLAMIIVAGGVVHAMLVDGTMETISKAALCALALGTAITVMVGLRVRRKQTKIAHL